MPFTPKQIQHTTIKSGHIYLYEEKARETYGIGIQRERATDLVRFTMNKRPLSPYTICPFITPLGNVLNKRYATRTSVETNGFRDDYLLPRKRISLSYVKRRAQSQMKKGLQSIGDDITSFFQRYNADVDSLDRIITIKE